MVAKQGLNEPEFDGQLILTNKTLSLRGTSVLLSSIIKFDQYGVPRKYTIPTWQLVLAVIVIGVFILQLYWGLLFVLPAIAVLYAGIRERRKPDLYGISLKLTSGREYTIVSRDIQGISLLCSRIKEAMRTDHNLKYVINFKGGRIDFDRHDPGSARNSPIAALG